MSAQFTPSEWKVIYRALRNGTEDGSLLEIASVESIEATILKALAVERQGTQPDPRTALLDEAVAALRQIKREAERANKDDGDGGDHLLLFIAGHAADVLARIDALEKGEGK